ncbi:MAG: ATP-binding protein [Ruminobacter sp.]|nr:ATP-binding protein [Ruminobacter sp.]
MLIEIRAKNCYSFNEPINISMKADMRNRKLACNVHQENNFSILKTAGIYGPNNVGKTCLVKCIKALKYILLNKKNLLLPNIFTDNPVCEMGVTFLSEGKKYSYNFKYDTEKNEYIYESFIEIIKDQYGNEKEEIWLMLDTQEKKFCCRNNELTIDMIRLVTKSNVLFHLIDSGNSQTIDKIKEILTGFADRIDIIDMNNIPIEHTITLMKNKNRLQEKIVEFIKNADLYMDNFEYVEQEKILFNGIRKPNEQVLDLPEKLMDQIRLVSTYKGKRVSSMLFDSTGTKKIAAMASYVIEALEQGRILVVDELDSSIHFRLTRAIVTMFNNELNTNAQMIFTVHDINLMDCRRLFRKEQIWFVHKDKERVYVYSLAEFTANDGVRDTSDIIEKYRKGAFAALPEPELIKSLLSIQDNSKKECIDDK